MEPALDWIPLAVLYGVLLLVGVASFAKIQVTPPLLLCCSSHLKLQNLYNVSGPAESVRLLRFWPDQFFSSILQKASNKQSASVILGLIRLIILSYNR